MSLVRCRFINGNDEPEYFSRDRPFAPNRRSFSPERVRETEETSRARSPLRSLADSVAAAIVVWIDRRNDSRAQIFIQLAVGRVLACVACVIVCASRLRR